ncbi:MAG: hypothetical protein ACRD12_12430, partial [Acidimicrobiales bacterium]
MLLGERELTYPRRMARRHQSRLAADRVWAVYLIAATIAGVLYLFVPPFSRNGPFFNVLGLSTAVAILAGVWL